MLSFCHPLIPLRRPAGVQALRQAPSRLWRPRSTPSTAAWDLSRSSVVTNAKMAAVPTGAEVESTTTTLRVITWNIDMHTRSISERTKAAVDSILQHSPPIDVVMLQEVTDVTKSGRTSAFATLKRALTPKYDLHVDPDWVARRSYFVVMFTRRGLFLPDPAVLYERFPQSNMGRAFVEVTGTLKSGVKIALLTSHLESERAGAKERAIQFGIIMAKMRTFEDEGVVSIFGGDTNLRETEISAKQIAKKPEHEAKEREAGEKKKDIRKISDAFIQAGAPADQKFTWDMKQNNNLENADWDFQPRSRYDRVFAFGPHTHYPVCTQWKLIGRQRLASGVFPSDHWGVYATFTLTAPKDKNRAGAAESKSGPKRKVDSDDSRKGPLAISPATVENEPKGDSADWWKSPSKRRKTTTQRKTKD